MKENYFVIKAFDNDEFYGYVGTFPAPQFLPEADSELPFYEDSIKNAREFPTIEAASKWIERFQNGTDLMFIIQETTKQKEEKNE